MDWRSQKRERKTVRRTDYDLSKLINNYTAIYHLIIRKIRLSSYLLNDTFKQSEIMHAMHGNSAPKGQASGASFTHVAIRIAGGTSVCYEIFVIWNWIILSRRRKVFLILKLEILRSFQFVVKHFFFFFFYFPWHSSHTVWVDRALYNSIWKIKKKKSKLNDTQTRFEFSL